jgi:hypothetical protein
VIPGLTPGATDMSRLRRLLSRLSQSYPSRMATIIEVKKLALDLPEKERAVLAANLLESLPGVLWDEDEGIAEALRRDAEMNANPEQGISLAQLDSGADEAGFLPLCAILKP